MKTRDSQIDFIRINGPLISACAWRGYREKGRGMICVLSDLHNELLEQVPFDFMPESDASKLIKTWYGTKEARMVSSYEPETEVVICFVRQRDPETTDVDAYKIKTRPTPPVAAEQND